MIENEKPRYYLALVENESLQHYLRRLNNYLCYDVETLFADDEHLDDETAYRKTFDDFRSIKMILDQYFQSVESWSNKLSEEYRKEKIKKVRYEMNRNRAETFYKIGRRDGFACKLCGISSRDLQVDHVVAVSRGGNNDLNNLQILCEPCNLAKSNKISPPFPAVIIRQA